MYNYGSLTLINNIISGNSAKYGGGGVCNQGNLTLIDDMISGNSAQYNGGGVCNYTPGSTAYNQGITATLTNDTISGNSATNGYGGGVYNQGNLTLTNDTISGNSAPYAGSDVCNYGSLTLTPVPTAPTVTDAGGVYNATPYVASVTSSLEGVTLDYQQYMDGVWFDLGTNAPVNVGSYDVTANLAGSTTDYGYATVSSTVDFSITPDPIVISVLPITPIQYGPNYPNFATSLSGEPAGNPDGIIVDANVCTQNQNYSGSYLLAAGTYNVEPGLSSNNNDTNFENYTWTSIDTTLTITPVPVTDEFTVANQTYDGLNSAKVTGTSLNTIFYGDNVQLTYSGATYGSPNAGAQTVTLNGAGLTGPDASNYSLITPITTTAIITPILTVTDAGGVYNGAPFAAVTTINGDSSFEGVTPTLDYQQPVNGVWEDLGVNAPANAGFYEVTANFAPIIGSTSSVLSPTVYFSIIPAPLTITAANSFKIYDGTTIVTDGATPTFTTLYGSDSITGLTESFTGSTAGSEQTQVNSGFTINDGNSGNNYDVFFNPSTGFINQAAITVSVAATSSSIVYGNAPTFTGEITGNPNNLQWTATLEENPMPFGLGYAYGVPSYSSSGHLCVGTYTVQAGLTGNNLNDYNVTYESSSLTVTPAPLIGHFTVANKVYDGTINTFATSTALTGVIPGDNVTLIMMGAQFSSPNAGTWTVTMAPSSWLIGYDQNYSLSIAPTTATITPANAQVMVFGYNTFYNAVSHTAVSTAIGIDGDAITGLNFNSTHTNVGTYTDTWTFTAPNSNYNNASGIVIDTITRSKSKMVRETVNVPKTVKVKVAERVWNGKRWVKKIETVLVTKMVKKAEMVKVYYS